MSNSHHEPILPVVKAEIGFPMHGGAAMILVDSAGIKWTHLAEFRGLDKERRAWVYAVEIHNSTHKQQVVIFTPFRSIAGAETAASEMVALEAVKEPKKAKAKRGGK